MAAVVLSLRAELERNQRILEGRLPVHEAIRDTFRLRLEAAGVGRGGTRVTADALPALTEIGFAEGLGLAGTLATGAWEAARASGAMTHMGVEEVFLLSSAYNAQREVEAAGQRLARKHDAYGLARVEGVHPTIALVDLTAALGGVVDAEQALCNTYVTLARRLSGGLADPDARCGSGNVTIR